MILYYSTKFHFIIINSFRVISRGLFPLPPPQKKGPGGIGLRVVYTGNRGRWRWGGNQNKLISCCFRGGPLRGGGGERIGLYNNFFSHRPVFRFTVKTVQEFFFFKSSIPHPPPLKSQMVRPLCTCFLANENFVNSSANVARTQSVPF